MTVYAEPRWIGDDAYDLSGNTVNNTATPSDTTIEIGNTGPANNPIGNVSGTGRSVTAGEIELRNIGSTSSLSSDDVDTTISMPPDRFRERQALR